MSDPILFGWCGSGQHNLCHQSYTTQVGVLRVCECPCGHGNGDNDE